MPASKLTAHRGLVAFDAGTKLELPTDGEGGLPTRIVVAPWGSHETAKGRIVIGDHTARELPGNQKRTNFDRVALDFNHNTVPGSEAYHGEPARVAAFATPSIIAGEGIVFEQVEWTPEGRDYVGGKHYIDLSPTLQLNARGEAVFIHSAAVCRNGAVPNLTLFSADPLHDKGKTTSPDLMYKDLLCAILGVDAASDDAAIESASKTFSSKVTALSAQTDQLKALSAIPDALQKLTTLSSTLEEKITKIESEQLDRLRADIVAQATREGKVIPAEAMPDKDGKGGFPPEQLKVLCASLPSTVPLDRRTPQLTALNAGTGVQGADSTELEIYSALGLTAEQVKKHNS